MKFEATTDGAAEGRTRDSVARLLLRYGPSTAASLGERLGLSPAAVRRHLDAMLAEGLVTFREVSARRRGRGRPARVFTLTDAARVHCGEHAYDDLAVSALRFMAQTGGERSVADFAEHRVSGFESRHRDRVARAEGTTRKVEALAAALTDEGYAASSHAVGSGGQLCQHHCPVAHVAAKFPQLCEAETRAFARMLGTHVQRLATIARGDVVCTTHVPAAGDTTVSSTPGPGRKSA